MIRVGEKQDRTIYQERKSCYGILYNELGQIAVVRKKNWGLIFPGGEVEEGEKSKETVKRETLEEIGFKVDELEYFNTIESYYKIDTELNGTVNCHNIADIYVGKILNKANNNCELDKTVEWFYPIDLLNKMKLNFQNVLLEFICKNHDRKDIICKITDEDFNMNSREFNNINFRYGARGIVIREDGKIALLNKVNKNVYKLPGGGIEDNELPEETFEREILEETGCIIKIIDKLGITLECKSLIEFKQISHIFISKVLEDTHKLELTPKEKEEGARLVWVTPKEAFNLINECYNCILSSNKNNSYSGKFVALRDKKILEYYIKTYMK